ncbi:MAG: relaxase/mobilization nuclease domain-containing protein [Ruminococcus sp.]|nr:relaxase/mobilization nuclease domain-containing protein [Ruminococcus sp.]
MRDKIKRTRSVQVRLTEEEFDYLNHKFELSGLHSTLLCHSSRGEVTPQKAFEIGMEICDKFLKFQYQYYLAIHTDKDHGLFVIEHPELGKGKSYWEWDLNRQGLSWKAKLKNAIDKVVSESENWEDLLRR